MPILLLDTAFSEAYAALFEGDELLAERRFVVERGRSDTLAMEVASLLQECSCRPTEIGRVGVGRGPGSFTGIRVAAAFAKGWVFATGAELVGFSSLAGFLPRAEGRFAAVVDARAGGVYLQLGHSARDCIDWEGEPHRVELERLSSILSSVDFVVSPHVELLMERIGCDFPWEESEVNGERLARLVYEGEPLKVGELALCYLSGAARWEKGE